MICHFKWNIWPWASHRCLHISFILYYSYVFPQSLKILLDNAIIFAFNGLTYFKELKRTAACSPRHSLLFVFLHSQCYRFPSSKISLPSKKLPAASLLFLHLSFSHLYTWKMYFAEYRILGQQFLSFGTLKMLCQFLLAFLASYERPALLWIIAPFHAV